MACADHSIVFRHLDMDFTIFFRVTLSDLSKLSISLRQKHNCEVKKYLYILISFHLLYIYIYFLVHIVKRFRIF